MMNSNDFVITLLKPIKIKRMKLKLSQEKLGILTGLNKSEISKIEKGNRNVTLETLHKLYSELDIKIFIE